MSTQTIQKIVSETVELPTLPPVVKEALEMLDRPRVSLAELEEVILRDQVISARILRIANSAFIGMERRVGRIFDALSLLGFTMIRALLVGAAMKDMHRQVGPTEKILWEHSIGVSLAAAMVARETGLVPPETALVSGLLHDIGRTAINNSAPRIYAEVIRKEREGAGETIVLEREALGYTHCDVGGAISDAWKFPKMITSAIKRHHRSSDTEGRSGSGDGHARLCDVVSLADELCHHIGIGFHKLPAVSDDLLFATGITNERFAEIANDFRKTVSDQIGHFMG